MAVVLSRLQYLNSPGPHFVPSTSGTWSETRHSQKPHGLQMAPLPCTSAHSRSLSHGSPTAPAAINSTWWRHQMETFFALLALCVGNSPVTGEFPSQRPVTRSFDVFFDLCLNKQLSKQSWGWWFDTPSRSLWRQRNGCPWLTMV